jgi:glyoxylase-like metal-dependent hydrolase (beta-lactamase superfamily II)
LPAFVDRLPDWVLRVSLPTPFRVGSVNCYVLMERPVTVIDPGTLQPGSLAKLREALNGNGLDFDDIEVVVVTHAHPDHYGAAAVLAARSSAQIVCGLPEVENLQEPEDVQSRVDLLVTLGLPDAEAQSLITRIDAQIARTVRRAPAEMVTGVKHGEVLTAGGRRLVCVVTPGHSDGHLSLWDPVDRVLLSGDHLLARIIPVPNLGEGARRRSLPAYLASLSTFTALDPQVVLPGHGRAFAEVDVLADRIRAHSRHRAEEIASLIREGPASVATVARRLQWHPEGGRLLLGLAHVQGHLDLLEDDGRVSWELDRGVRTYGLRS